MLIVADTSALIALATCNGLSWLDALFSEIHVPPAVYNEATAQGKPHATTLEKYLQRKVSTVDLSDFIIASSRLGRGELEAMALYKHQQADRLLIDDLQARKTASYNRINIIGSVGILLLAKKNELISMVRPYLDTLQQSTLHISQNLINEALKIADEAQ
jgi:predicted nucleic acid-binding protein